MNKEKFRKFRKKCVLTAYCKQLAKLQHLFRPKVCVLGGGGGTNPIPILLNMGAYPTPRDTSPTPLDNIKQYLLHRKSNLKHFMILLSFVVN